MRQDDCKVSSSFLLDEGNAPHPNPLPFVGEETLQSSWGRGVTVQTCGVLGTIRPLVEGQPSTEFPLQTVSVPSNVNSYDGERAVDSYFDFSR